MPESPNFHPGGPGGFVCAYFWRLVTPGAAVAMTDNQAAQSYFPGLAIDLRILGNSSTAPDSIIRVHVTSVFAPFTKSQVMRITFPSELGSGFPENAVLKLYDRRYIDDRREQVWSPSREIAARAAWREKRWDGVEIIEGDFSHDWDEFDETKWEEFFRQLMQVRKTKPTMPACSCVSTLTIEEVPQ